MFHTHHLFVQRHIKYSHQHNFDWWYCTKHKKQCQYQLCVKSGM